MAVGVDAAAITVIVKGVDYSFGLAQIDAPEREIGDAQNSRTTETCRTAFKSRRGLHDTQRQAATGSGDGPGTEVPTSAGGRWEFRLDLASA